MNKQNPTTAQLGPDALAVYDAIVAQARGRDHVPLNLSAIQEATGLSRGAVLRAIDTLAEDGKIRLGLTVANRDEDNEATGGAMP